MGSSKPKQHPFYPSKHEFRPGYTAKGYECTALCKKRRYRCEAKCIAGKKVCRVHGGASRSKHGLTNALPPPKIRERIEQLVRDPRVVDLKEYAARVFAMLESVEALVAETGYSDSDREKLLPLVKHGIEAAEKFHRLATDKRFVDIIEARGFISRALETLLQFVSDERRDDAIAAVHEILGDEDAGTRPHPGAAGSLH